MTTTAKPLLTLDYRLLRSTLLWVANTTPYLFVRWSEQTPLERYHFSLLCGAGWLERYQPVRGGDELRYRLKEDGEKAVELFRSEAALLSVLNDYGNLPFKEFEPLLIQENERRKQHG
ncbi:MAG TPA: hypothetical protein VNQ76_15315 [Planctomicrobium sp.]|nr:hypothetical protein [Planctomicrobium sp.]